MPLLEQKVLVVTGAANGIGRAVALACAREGARLMLADLGTSAEGEGADPNAVEAVAALARELGAEVRTEAGDLREPAVAERLVERTTAEWGQLDGLICCAGVRRDQGLLRQSLEDFRAVYDGTLLTTLLPMQAAARWMSRHGGGRIVTTTGVAGLQGNVGQAAYSAAAGAIHALTRTASIELQRAKITVNAVAPLAKTRQTEDLPLFEKLESVRVEHVVAAYLFLVSELCGTRSGMVLAAAGGKLAAHRLSESAGRYKDEDEGVWTAEEIDAAWSALTR